MAELIRVTTYWAPRVVYRSAITGKFVSKRHYLDNPDTTYKSSVKMPHYEWIDVDELLQGFRQIQFYDSTEDEWLIRLQEPILMTELSMVCDKVGIPFDWIVETIYNLPYWRDSLRVDVHEFKKQGA